MSFISICPQIWQSLMLKKLLRCNLVLWITKQKSINGLIILSPLTLYCSRSILEALLGWVHGTSTSTLRRTSLTMYRTPAELEGDLQRLPESQGWSGLHKPEQSLLLNLVCSSLFESKAPAKMHCQPSELSKPGLECYWVVFFFTFLNLTQSGFPESWVNSGCASKTFHVVSHPSSFIVWLPTHCTPVQWWWGSWSLRICMNLLGLQ